MGYNQNFGPNRKGAKHGKEMISRIMSGKDTSEGMDDYSYKVPAEKLEDIQNSKGLRKDQEKDLHKIKQIHINLLLLCVVFLSVLM